MKKNIKKLYIFIVLFLMLGFTNVKALEVSNKSDFIDALNNQEVDEIKLTSSISITDEDISGISINAPVESVNRTLDLNGQTINSSVTNISCIKIAFNGNNKTFTITDSSENGRIYYLNQMFMIETVSENNKIIINNGIFVNDYATSHYLFTKNGEGTIYALINNGTFYYRNNSPLTSGFNYSIKNMSVYGVNQSDSVGFFNGTSETISDIVLANSDIYLNDILYEEDRNETLARNIYFDTTEGNSIVIREHKEMWTVSFDTNGGSDIDDQSIEDGQIAVQPVDPTNGDLIFTGWYIDDTFASEFDFSTPITDNITLHAGWEEKNVNISSSLDTVNFGNVVVGFESNVTRSITITNTGNVNVTISNTNPSAAGPFGNINYDTTQVLEPNESIEVTLIVGPSYNNADVVGNYEGVYEFTADEVDGDGTKTINVTGNVSIVEEQPSSYTVTFNTNGGSNIDSQTVDAGGTATIPEDPTKNGFRFSGWYEDDTLTTEFDFTKAITANTVIYAKWLEYYTVTFDCDVLGANKPADQLVLHGETIVYPNIPETYGEYVLDGYFLDSEYLILYETDPVVTSNKTIYIKYRQITSLIEIEEINLTVTPPKVGETTTTEKEDDFWIWETQTNQLNIVVEEGAHYRLEDGDGDFNYMAWVKGFTTAEDLSTPFIGTFEKNKSYYGNVFIEALDGYKFADDCVINVNGEPVGRILSISDYLNGTFMEVGITIKPQIVGGVVYEILDGGNQTYYTLKDKELVVRADGLLEDLQEVLVDAKKVDSSNYTLKSGSTILTLKSSYLNTLASGNHTLTLKYDDGEVSTNFVINNVDNPQTGDNVYIYVIAFIISCFGMAFEAFQLKKNN